MTLEQSILLMATSVDRPDTADETRFNASEREELLAMVDGAPRDELLEAARLLQPDALVPQRPSALLWGGRDAPFGRQLAASVQERLTLPQPASSPAAVPSMPAQTAARPTYAVLVVDATGEYVAGSAAQRERQQAAMRAVLDHANAKHIPVFEIVWPDLFETNPRLAGARRPENWVRIEKSTMGAFESTGIARELRHRGITHVVIMGQFQDSCVLATAEAAHAAGIRVETSPDLLQRERGEGPSLPRWYAQNGTVRANHRDLPFFRHRPGTTPVARGASSD